jgi:hypothetical protein
VTIGGGISAAGERTALTAAVGRDARPLPTRQFAGPAARGNALGGVKISLLWKLMSYYSASGGCYPLETTSGS